MAQPAKNLSLVSTSDDPATTDADNDVSGKLAIVAADVTERADATDTDVPDEENRVRQTVQEFCELQRDMHDLRENLVALGAPFQTVAVLVEMGFNERHDEQEKLIRSCLESSKVNGRVDAEISDRFRQQLLMLTELERDMALARKVAKQSGFVLPALNALTNMIRQNPGDGGHKVVNSFLAYALASDIKMDQIQEILDKANEEQKSVLPVIEIEQADPAIAARRALIRDIVLGICLTIGVMWLVV